MYKETVSEIVSNSHTMRAALENLVIHYDNEHLGGFQYGFFVHLHGRDRNDFLFEHTSSDEGLVEAFMAVGGTATDIVATKLEKIERPYKIDLDELAAGMRKSNDFRLKYVERIRGLDLRLAWICPINRPWVGGYGVLNQFFRKTDSEPVVPADDMVDFAHHFHQEAKRHGLIAKCVGLTKSQSKTLAKIAMGKTAEDLAHEGGVSGRAIEKRLQAIRLKLRARNTLEAVYKASIYGVLPFPLHDIDLSN